MSFEIPDEVECLKKDYFGHGATRTAGTPRFDLIPPEALLCLAERFTLGARVHGDDNWKKGMPQSVIIQHLLSHIVKLQMRDFKEDDAWGHIGAILWAGAALAWYHHHRKESE